MVSATTYTLVGVVNKFITVLLNVFIWDKHSTPLGLFAVCICLGAGMFYEQAPLRETMEKKQNSLPKDTEEGDIPLLGK
jgi:GDP-mannose transporter